MPVHRWTMWDPESDTTLTFPMNPVEGSLPSFEANITQHPTVAPDGMVLLFEGRDAAQTFPFSGWVLTQTHYQFLVNWFRLKRQVRVTDDLGNQFWLYLTKFTPTRKRSINFDWLIEYDAEAIILDWSTDEEPQGGIYGFDMYGQTVYG